MLQFQRWQTLTYYRKWVDCHWPLLNKRVGFYEVLCVRLNTLVHYHLSSLHTAVGQHINIQAGDPGPDGHAGRSDVSVVGFALWFCFSAHTIWIPLGDAKNGVACGIWHRPLSRHVNFYPNINFTEGLPLCGHAKVVVRSLGLESWDTAGQREDEGGLVVYHGVGTHTFQSVGVNQLRTRLLEKTLIHIQLNNLSVQSIFDFNE